ncbi:uncharacterized protein BDZ99DRAFT_472959 [Mytilinidion resinicola]|uniref:Uncharacterized protein n=1 Tax=Mytilinidion resinicola TaxID=574789 RepID=A0A6A6Z0J5_9PEZI|nr:uncharacterized protein BDZ99DRAFT_472959 [Mytilinidion resinicola]KAF2813794.1 hypothetical protein BDZ99DRAFT_472959 [Mytilinidion resinicola]
MAPAIAQVECFGDGTKGSPHYRSARDLHKRGIWIGYLDDHKKKFEDMPSFQELIKRYKGSVTPFPEPTVGASGNTSYAVCNGCHINGEDTRLIKVLHLPFTNKKNKVLIMPLEDDNSNRLFCILQTETFERKFTKYTFWQVEGGCSSYISLLGTTASNQRKGTLDEIRALRVNNSQREEVDQADAAPKTKAPNKPSNKRSREAAREDTGPSKRKITTPANGSSDGPRLTSSSTLRQDEAELDRFVAAIGSASQAKPAEPVRRAIRSSGPLPAIDASTTSSKPHTPNWSHAATVGYQGEADSEPSDGLSKAQARRIRFSWTFNADGREGQIVLCLADCPNSKRFLELLEEEANQEQATKDIHAKAKSWWVDRTEVLEGGKKETKGLRITPSNEASTDVAFRLTLEEIAKSRHWESGKGDYTVVLNPII